MSLRNALNVFHSAESQEQFAKAGYSAALLLIVIPLGALLSLLGPSPQVLVDFTKAAAARMQIPEVVLSYFPAPLATLVLLWMIGRFIRQVRIWIGSRFAELFLRSLEFFAALGEFLAENRRLAATLVLLLLAVGVLCWVEYSDLEETHEKSEQIVVDWVEEVSTIVETSTHSVRDITAFQALDSTVTSELASTTIEENGQPLQCLADFIENVFAPMETSSDQQTWTDRMRGLVNDHLESGCGQLGVADAYAPRSLDRKATSLYKILLGRSFSRLAGDDCAGSFNLARGLQAYSDASVELHASARQSGIGNVYGCLARLYAWDLDVPEELREKCQTARDCYRLAIDNHRKSAREYRQCSFPDLRATNNMADLTLKLAMRKWADQKDRRVTFIDDKTIRRTLETLSNKMVDCMSKDRTPTEAIVTIAQVFGTLSQQPEQSEVSEWPSTTSWYLALSLLGAPADFQLWDLRYFCGLYDRESRTLAKVASDSFSRARVPDATTEGFSSLLGEQCLSLNFE